ATFSGPVTLTAPVAINTATAGADGALSFISTVNSNPAGFDLTITADSANVDVTGAVGASPNNLGNLTVASANQVTFGSTVRANNVSLTATTVRFTGDVTALTDDVMVNGNVMLLADTTLTSGGGAGDDITVTGTIDGAGKNLKLVAGAGSITVGDIGDGGRL